MDRAPRQWVGASAATETGAGGWLSSDVWSYAFEHPDKSVTPALWGKQAGQMLVVKSPPLKAYPGTCVTTEGTTRMADGAVARGSVRVQVVEGRMPAVTQTVTLGGDPPAALAELIRLTGIISAHAGSDDDRVFFDADLAFHVRIAEATGNPFFAMRQKIFSGVVIQAQMHGARRSYERRVRAVQAHESLCDAMGAQDAERARVEMEAHLRYGATHYLPDHHAAPANG